jgi:hypothetical protein
MLTVLTGLAGTESGRGHEHGYVLGDDSPVSVGDREVDAAEPSAVC